MWLLQGGIEVVEGLGFVGGPALGAGIYEVQPTIMNILI